MYCARFSNILQREKILQQEFMNWWRTQSYSFATLNFANCSCPCTIGNSTHFDSFQHFPMKIKENLPKKEKQTRTIIWACEQSASLRSKGHGEEKVLVAVLAIDEGNSKPSLSALASTLTVHVLVFPRTPVLLLNFRLGGAGKIEQGNFRRRPVLNREANMPWGAWLT